MQEGNDFYRSEEMFYFPPQGDSKEKGQGPKGRFPPDPA